MVFQGLGIEEEAGNLERLVNAMAKSDDVNDMYEQLIRTGSAFYTIMIEDLAVAFCVLGAPDRLAECLPNNDRHSPAAIAMVFVLPTSIEPSIDLRSLRMIIAKIAGKFHITRKSITEYTISIAGTVSTASDGRVDRGAV
ncbi:hypothetical protein Q7P37_003140 [Cladosporium fusiforme]